MEKYDFLNKMYNNPEVGLKGVNKLFLYLRTKYPDKHITKEEIENFLKTKKEDQLFKVVKKDILKDNPVITKKLGEINVDLMEMGFYSSANKGYKFILFVIDTYSRYVFMRALKDKTAESVLKGFDTILDEYKNINVKISNIVCDMGKEFSNKKFLNYFGDVYRSGKIFFKDAELHNSALSINDRAMRTIRGLFKKLFILNNNFNWIDFMYKIERNYNNTPHSGLSGDTPYSIFYGKKDKIIKPDRIIEKLEIGDKVRIKNQFETFNKKYSTLWTTEIFEIEKLDGNGYRLKDKRRKYFFNELLKVDEKTDNNENFDKVVKRNKIDKKLEKQGQSKITDFYKSNKINNKLNKLNNLLK